MFTMKTDLSSGIIDITVSGIWTMELIGGFARALESAARQVAMTGKRHTMLCDFSTLPIQPQEIVAAVQGLARSPKLPSRKCALFTEGVLARQQAKRVAMANDHVAVFSSRNSALDWLLDEATPMRPADHYYAAAPRPRDAHPATLPSRPFRYAAARAD